MWMSRFNMICHTWKHCSYFVVVFVNLQENNNVVYPKNDKVNLTKLSHNNVDIVAYFINLNCNIYT